MKKPPFNITEQARLEAARDYQGEEYARARARLTRWHRQVIADYEHAITTLKCQSRFQENDSE